MTRAAAALSLILALAGPPAMAQQTGMDEASARAIVDGCAAFARARSQSHAIVVVDTGGNIVAALRMDGNRSGIFEFAQAKAQAVAAWGFSTAQMAEGAKATPGFDRAPHVVTVPGGVPVFSSDGKTFIGAVGASGEAPADDAACAEAGIAAAGLKSSRAR